MVRNLSRSHDKPLQPVQYYRTKCLACRTANFPVSHPAKDSNCLQCHMPQLGGSDGGHTAFTDHRIQRRPEAQRDAPSDSEIVAWREPAPDLRKRNLGIANIQVGLQRQSPALVGQGYRDLTEVQQQFADDSDFFKWIGEALLGTKHTSEAKIAFERSLQLRPDSATAETRLAAAYLQGGDTDVAIAHLQRAMELAPLDLPTASTLFALYEQRGRNAESLELSSKIKTAMAQEAALPETAPTPPVSGDSKDAQAVFKNIQVLKDVPAGSCFPRCSSSPRRWESSRTFCHVEGHFEKDEKKPKQVARDMMNMMFTLNNNNFADHREVTCSHAIAVLLIRSPRPR